MARSRNIKPSFFTNDELAELMPLTRLLFIGLWCVADREGRLDDRPRKLKAEILPYDNIDVDASLTDLHNAGFIHRYSIDANEYIQIINFTKHQSPHIKETASEIPAPPGHEDSGVVPYYVPSEQRQRIMAKYKMQCAQCGARTRLSIDHITPRSLGGTNEDSNLQVLCIACNSTKGSRHDNPSSERTGNSGASLGNSETSRPDSLNLIPDSLNTSSDDDSSDAREARITPKHDEDSVSYQLAVHLRARVLDNLPNAKVPPPDPQGMSRWSRDIERMIRLDKRSPAQIRAVIDWCQSDTFWMANVLSANALRRHWDKLVLQKQRGSPGEKRSQKPEALRNGSSVWDDLEIYRPTAREVST